MKSEGVGLIVRAISFQDFQPMWSWSTNVTDRRTDGRTDDVQSQYRALHFRAVKVGKILLKLYYCDAQYVCFWYGYTSEM